VVVTHDWSDFVLRNGNAAIQMPGFATAEQPSDEARAVAANAVFCLRLLLTDICLYFIRKTSSSMKVKRNLVLYF
jgi:hypothetical protein